MNHRLCRSVGLVGFGLVGGLLLASMVGDRLGAQEPSELPPALPLPPPPQPPQPGPAPDGEQEPPALPRPFPPPTLPPGAFKPLDGDAKGVDIDIEDLIKGAELDLELDLEPIDPKEIVEGLQDAKALAEARFRLAEEMMESTMLLALEPPRPGQTSMRWIPDFLLWAGRRLDAKLDMCDEKEEQIAEIAEEIARMKGLERTFARLGPGPGLIRPIQAELEFYRLELESRLAELVADD